MIRAVVFDLDGTTLYTLKDLQSALNHSLREYGYEEMPTKKVREYIGNGIRMLILRSAKEETHVDEMNVLFKEYYAVHCNDETLPYPGIAELLADLKKEGLHLGLISNKPKYALGILAEKHFPDIFEIIIGDMEGIKRKPDPESMNILMKKWNIPSEEILYVGDSEVDITYARNAGCKILSVTYGYRDKGVLEELKPDFIADSAEEMAEIIKKARA